MRDDIQRERQKLNGRSGRKSQERLHLGDARRGIRGIMVRGRVWAMMMIVCRPVSLIDQPRRSNAVVVVFQDGVHVSTEQQEQVGRKSGNPARAQPNGNVACYSHVCRQPTMTIIVAAGPEARDF